MNKLNKKGFTLVELVIVVAVIAILSAVLIPTVSDLISSSKDAATLSAARNAYTEYITYAAQAGVENEEDLVYYSETNKRYVIFKDGTIDEATLEEAANIDAADAAIAAYFGYAEGTEVEAVAISVPVFENGKAVVDEDGNAVIHTIVGLRTLTFTAPDPANPST